MPKMPKNAEKYSCKLCNFICSKKSNYDTHLLRPKHKNRTFLNNLEQKNAENAENTIMFNCKYCEKPYGARNSLWYHEKKCAHNHENDCKSTIINDPSDKELIMMLIKENSEFKDMMIELCKNGTNIINNNNAMNNSNNKTFNLQLFLNETCKDAMNIMDFVDSLKLQLCDLERIGEVGFVTGISDIIIKNLKALDISKRPIHCADTKREVMYVKDNNIWEKEQEGNKKLKKAIKHIAKKNSMNINLFKDKYPDCINSHSRKSDQFNKIYIEAYGGSGNEDVDNENKIIKNIAKVVFIDKSL